MQFVRPTPFLEAVEKLGRRSPIGSRLTTDEWRMVPVALRERAFFSATVEDARMCQGMRDWVGDYLASSREQIALPDGTVTTALKVGSRAEFVARGRQLARSLGLGPADPEDAGTLKDIRSERRLGLIFDTQTQAAHDYGAWKQGMDPDVLNEFPAQRFIREVEVRVPRPYHQAHQNEVHLKSDLDFWLAMNRDLGVPWGPWGFNSGMGVEDVDRDEAERLGLISRGAQAKPVEKDFNDRLQASVSDLDPDIVRWLQDQFGGQLVVRDGVVDWSSMLPTIPPGVSTAIRSPEPPNWQKRMDLLVGELEKTTTHSRKEQIRETARELLSVPAGERKSPQMIWQTKSRAVRTQAMAGSDLIARYVRPDLAATTRVTVVASKQRRAFHRNSEIHISSGTSAAVVAHEIVHAIEQQHPKLLQAAAEFLLKRGRGEAPQLLRTLTGISGYRADERAFEDDWTQRGGTVYAGKVYSSASAPSSAADFRATEILTTGLERMIADPIGFFKKDREWFELVVSLLRGI